MGPEVESSSQLGTDGPMRPLLRMACWLNKQVRPANLVALVLAEPRPEQGSVRP